MQFPSLPTNGQICVLNKKTYTYDSDSLTWYIEGSSPYSAPAIEYTWLVTSTGVRYTFPTDIDIFYNELWDRVRAIRDQRIAEVEWRYARYNRFARLGKDQIDDLSKLDSYIQALADITNQESPNAIEWPVITDYTQD